MRGIPMRKIIVKATACIAGVLFLIAACSLDSKELAVPLITMLITGGLLGLLAYANHWFN